MTTGGWGGVKSSWNSLSPLGQAGIATQGFGALNSIVSSYYAAQTEKYKTKSPFLFARKFTVLQFLLSGPKFQLGLTLVNLFS